MGVTDRAGKCIGGIGARHRRQTEQAPHHLLHLFFARMAIADDRLLDLQRSVFGYRQPSANGGADGRPARLPEEQGRLRIDIDKYFLDCHLIGQALFHHFGQSFENCLDAFRKLRLRRTNTATGDIDQTTSGRLDQAKSGHAQARINAKYAHVSDTPERPRSSREH